MATSQLQPASLPISKLPRIPAVMANVAGNVAAIRDSVIFMFIVVDWYLFSVWLRQPSLAPASLFITVTCTGLLLLLFVGI